MESEEKETTRPPQPPIAPASEGSKLITTVLTILVCVQLIAIALLYFATDSLEEQPEETPTGSFALAERSAASYASVRFGQMSEDPKPTELTIRLENVSMTISYSFPEGDESGELIPSEYHLDVPQISYYDSDENNRVNSGDELYISGLESQTDYAIRLLWASTGETMDTANLFVPGSGMIAPTGSFCGVDVTGEYSATVTFCVFGDETSPTDLMIVLEDSTEWGAYVLLSGEDDTVMIRHSGSDMATIRYRDQINNGVVNLGDELMISDLDEGSAYTIRMLWRSSGELLDFRDFTTAGYQTPSISGSFVLVETLDTDLAVATFGIFGQDTKPIRINIILGKEPYSGTYNFPSNDNGTVLAIQSGLDIADLTYLDYADNQIIDPGDQLWIEGLEQDEHYTIIMIDGYTGSLMDVEFFSTTSPGTPAGQFSIVHVTSNTSAEAVFAKLTGDPPPTYLKIVLEVGANSGIYSFPSDADGTIATLDSGTDLGTITYRDFIDNEKVNIGDKLMLTDLRKSSDYSIYLIWAPNGDLIDSEEFTTAA